MMASNLDSVYNMCRLVLPHMRKHHWGRIVNLGAVGAERAHGQPKVSAYSAAKAAVIAFSKALALEEARCGITVNVVSPGVLADGDGGRVIENATPSDRVPGRPLRRRRGRRARRPLLRVARRGLPDRPGAGGRGRLAAVGARPGGRRRCAAAGS